MITVTMVPDVSVLLLAIAGYNRRMAAWDGRGMTAVEAKQRSEEEYRAAREEAMLAHYGRLGRPDPDEDVWTFTFDSASDAMLFRLRHG